MICKHYLKYILYDGFVLCCHVFYVNWAIKIDGNYLNAKSDIHITFDVYAHCHK